MTSNKHPPRQHGEPPAHSGRQTKFTLQQIATALRIAGGIHADACRVLFQQFGHTVSASTMGRLVASSPVLQQVKLDVESVALDYAESALWKRVAAGDSSAIQFVLRTKGAHRGWRTTVQHTGDKDNPLHTEVSFNFDDVPLDQLRAMQGTLEAARNRAVHDAGIDPDGEDGGDPLPPPPPLPKHETDDAQRDEIHPLVPR